MRARAPDARPVAGSWVVCGSTHGVAFPRARDGRAGPPGPGTASAIAWAIFDAIYRAPGKLAVSCRAQSPTQASLASDGLTID
jgi:hypothetical protein